MKMQFVRSPSLGLLRNPKAWLIAVPVLLLFVLFVWLTGTVLHLAGWRLWIFRIGLGMLAITAAVLILAFFRKRQAASGPVDDELDATVATARARLASAHLAGGVALNKLPMLVFTGPEGSTKTTTIVRSGLEPDLLAGEVFRGDTIGPTSGVNLWYSKKVILLEAGGKLLEDASRWDRLITHIRPERLAAVLAGQPQAPRVVVVCFSCEELLKPGSAEAVPAAAQRLREKLTQVSRGLGVRLPVYVLFTKADRIPFFADYVRSFSNEEAQQVMGTTLRLPLASASASFADREYQRLDDAFQQLFSSLAAKRLELLPRETGAENKAGTYEFAREFRKMSATAVQFLVELCKPSQLAVSPLLRGFYFSGVRAVIVSDAAPQMAPPGAAGPMAATQVFNPASQQPVAARGAAPSPMSRKVPQWLFLGRLFRDVILGDRAAMGVPQAGARLNLLRRLVLSSAAALSALLALGLLVSYLTNWRLERRVFNAAGALVGVVSNEPELPTLETLRRLDALGRQVEVLGEYEQNGPPWRYRWGLYTGAAIYPAARQIYADRLESLMLVTARRSLLNSLTRLPDSPEETSDYGDTYENLKAYLMTTTHPDQIDTTFLAPVLWDRWLDSRQIDTERMALARRQFDFYSEKLCQVHSCASQADAAIVARTRAFLLQFAGTERIYQLMVSEASTRNPPVEFNRAFQGSSAVLANAYEVPGAFTKGGWAFMQDAFENVDQFFLAEDWVIGEQALLRQDRPRLVRDLRTRYLADYARHWRDYLTSASVVRFTNLRDAAQKLTVLSSNESPLLQLFSLASQHTAVDSQTIGAVFQPVLYVMPPDTNRYVLEPNQAYMNGLIALQSSVVQTANAPRQERPTVAAQAREKAANARVAVQQMAQNFSIAGEARTVGTTIQKLMQDPIRGAERWLNVGGGGGGPVTVNQRARDFCRPFQQLMAKYPFNPRATAEATLAEMAGMFQPETGGLWTFFQNNLQELLVKQGSGVAVQIGASTQPLPDFVDFFNRAASVSDALWRSGGNDPRFDFTFRPLLSEAVPSVTFNVDGQTRRFTRTQAAQWRFSWIGSGARAVRLSAHISGRDEPLLELQGQWALFQFFQRGTWRESGTAHVIHWVIPTQGEPVSLEAELRLGGAAPILRSDFFTGLGCVSRVVR
jgi:type VI secretion system protein ImpL